MLCYAVLRASRCLPKRLIGERACRAHAHVRDMPLAVACACMMCVCSAAQRLCGAAVSSSACEAAMRYGRASQYSRSEAWPAAGLRFRRYAVSSSEVECAPSI